MNIESNKQDIFKHEFIFAMTALYGVDLDVTEELLDIIENIDFDALQQKLMADMETVLVYSVDCDKSYATSYRSEPLFETRAAKIVTVFERGCFSEITDEYETELWVTEDYKFAVVKVFRIEIKGQYKTEFRTVKGYIPEQNSILCDLGDFESVVQNHIASYYEMETPICELTEYKNQITAENGDYNLDFYFATFKVFNQALIELLTNNSTTVKGVSLTKSKIYDKFIEYVEFKNGYPTISDLQNTAIDDFTNACAEKTIKNHLAYMKSCIWNVMQVGNICEQAMIKRDFG